MIMHTSVARARFYRGLPTPLLITVLLITSTRKADKRNELESLNQTMLGTWGHTGIRRYTKRRGTQRCLRALGIQTSRVLRERLLT